MAWLRVSPCRCASCYHTAAGWQTDRGSGFSASEITQAVQRRLTSPARLLVTLEVRHAIRHRDLITQVLGDAVAGVHSQLEYRFGRDVARSHGLPTGQRQFRVPATTRLADVAYEEFALLIELDGRIGHVEEGMWLDRRRDNAHAIVEWLTLRFGWREVVHTPVLVAADIAAVLWPRLLPPHT